MEQSDAFISYRRKDVEFVKQIVQALQATGRELWVDWEDIPPGVEGFADEIQRGIEGANAFIAILSPAYLESEYCLMELREALRLKKRIVPIVYQKFEPLQPPEGIGHINWVYFTPHAGLENTFEQSFPKVIQALEADYEFAREHTRLLARALEWDKRQRENSFLLKGAEIDQAEGWQVKATGKSPAPTELQLEYVLNSRKQQRLQQRRITAAIGVLLVMAVIAAIFAVIQANAARISAEIAHSNELASDALQPGNEDVAIALALEATRSEHAPASAYNTLARVAYQTGSIRHLITVDDNLFEFISPAFSPDGKQAVIHNKLYDLVTGKVIREFQQTPSYSLTGVFTTNGTQVVIAGDDQGYNDPSAHPIFLGLYDVKTGKLLRTFDTRIGIQEVELSADGNTLIAFQPDGKAAWWDLHTGKKLREFETSDQNNSILAFSPDLKWMAQASIVEAASGAQYRNNLTIMDTKTLQTQYTISDYEGSDINLLRFSNNSKELAVSSWDSTTYNADISIISLESGKLLTWFQDVPASTVSIHFSPDDRKLVTASQDQTVTLWDRASGRIIKKQTAHHSPLIFADFVQNGNSVASIDGNGIIMVWDAQPGNLAKDLALPYENMDTTTSDGRYVISEGYNPSNNNFEVNRLVIRDELTMQDVSHLPIAGNTIKIQSFWTAEGWENGTFCYTDSLTSSTGETIGYEVYIASLKTGAIQQTWTLKSSDIGYINTARILPSGKELYIQYSDTQNLSHLEVWDIASGTTLHKFPVKSTNQRIALSPDGSHLLMANDVTATDGTTTSVQVDVVDTATTKTLYSFEPKSDVASILFTPDSKQFAIIAQDTSGAVKSYIVVYDVPTGATVHAYSINAVTSSVFAISPDGKNLLTGFSGGGGGGGGPGTPSGIYLGSGTSIAGSLKEWDFATGELLWDFSTAASNGFFSADSKYIFSSLGDLNIWRIDSPKALIAWVCANRYLPEFTEKERQRFDVDAKQINMCKSLNK